MRTTTCIVLPIFYDVGKLFRSLLLRISLQISRASRVFISRVASYLITYRALPPPTLALSSWLVKSAVARRRWLANSSQASGILCDFVFKTHTHRKREREKERDKGVCNPFATAMGARSRRNSPDSLSVCPFIAAAAYSKYFSGMNL